MGAMFALRGGGRPWSPLPIFSKVPTSRSAMPGCVHLNCDAFRRGASIWGALEPPNGFLYPLSQQFVTEAQHQRAANGEQRPQTGLPHNGLAEGVSSHSRSEEHTSELQ